MTTKATLEFANDTVNDAYNSLGAPTDGLTEDEAKKRISEFGYNELPEKRKNPLLDFLGRYWGPMPWLLELTMALSYAIGHYLEMAIVFALLTINAIIGFHHTRRSMQALELLKKRLAIRAKALRNGQWAEMEATTQAYTCFARIVTRKDQGQPKPSQHLDTHPNQTIKLLAYKTRH